MAVCLGWALGLTAWAQGSAELRVGAQSLSTESAILAEIVAQTAQQAGQPAQVRQGVGGSTIAMIDALRAGQIDAYVDYTGALAQALVQNPGQSTPVQVLDSALAPHGLGAGIALGFHSGPSLAMRVEQAQELGISTLSDLARQPQLRLGLSGAFSTQAGAWPGLSKHYGLTQQPRTMEQDAALQALAQRQLDVVDIGSTEAQVRQFSLQVLQDDRGYFPRNEAVLVYRRDLPQRMPNAWQALQKLQGGIGDADMVAMNAQARGVPPDPGVPADAVARSFLNWLLGPVSRSAGEGAGASALDRPLITPAPADTAPTLPPITPINPNAPAAAEAAASAVALPPLAAASASFGDRLWYSLTGDGQWRMLGRHLLLVLLPLALGAAVAVPLGAMLFARLRAREGVLRALGILQAMPALAVLAALAAALGGGLWLALLALTVYCILPILRATCAGLAAVPAGQRNAAISLGMRPPERLAHIELPQALPTVAEGMRSASAGVIGVATLAALIDAGGLGERIVAGLARGDAALMLAGALPVLVLALISELAFQAWSRALRRQPQPRSVRKKKSASASRRSRSGASSKAGARASAPAAATQPAPARPVVDEMQPTQPQTLPQTLPHGMARSESPLALRAQARVASRIHAQAHAEAQAQQAVPQAMLKAQPSLLERLGLKSAKPRTPSARRAEEEGRRSSSSSSSSSSSRASSRSAAPQGHASPGQRPAGKPGLLDGLRQKLDKSGWAERLRLKPAQPQRPAADARRRVPAPDQATRSRLPSAPARSSSRSPMPPPDMPSSRVPTRAPGSVRTPTPGGRGSGAV